MRNMVGVAVAVAVFAGASVAQAQTGTTGRPRGFAMEVELAGSANVASYGDSAGAARWSVAPRLFIGAQLNRFSIGGRLAISMLHVAHDDGPDPTYWMMGFGPAFDIEIWSAGAGAIILAAAVPFRIVAAEDNYAAPGFGVDFGFGGRFFVGRWFAVTVKMGSLLDAMFWDYDDRDDPDRVTVQWTLYGSVAVRFVASR